MTPDTLAHLHATHPVARRASAVVEALRSEGTTLAVTATDRALAATETLCDGRFQRSAAPRVDAAILDSGPAILRLTWNRNDADRWPPATPFAARPASRFWRTDEEETGWPTATVDVIVEPRAGGSQIAALSSRPPGADVSTNRIDKHVRDRLARAAMRAFLEALATDLEATIAPVAEPAESTPAGPSGRPLVPMSS
jgi:hypothetical protein